jgi:hypothetical protein
MDGLWQRCGCRRNVRRATKAAAKGKTRARPKSLLAAAPCISASFHQQRANGAADLDYLPIDVNSDSASVNISLMYCGL